MGKKLLCCMIILLVAFTACSRQKKDDERLNILCFSYQTTDISQAYLRARDPYQSFKNPHYITPDEDFSNVDELYESMMKGFLKHSPEIDMFIIYSRNVYAREIIENHYYVDLSQDEALMAYYDDMYPGIKEWCSDEGAVFGFPYGILYPLGIMADESKMGEIGYTAEDIGTMTGLLEFCDAWRKEKSSPAIAGHYMPAVEYCRNYMYLAYDGATGELNLDTPEFRSLLSECRNLAQTQPIFQEPFGSGNAISDEAPLYFGFTGLIAPQYPQYRPVPYPLIDGEPPGAKRNAILNWIMINPYSEHIDWALRCIEGLAQTSGDMDWSVSPIYLDVSYYNDPNAGDYVNEVLYTQEELDRAAPFVQEHFAGLAFPGSGEVTAILDAYITEGTKTIDEAIAESQRILDTMQKEQYLN